MIVPTRNRVDEPGRVELADAVGQRKLGMVIGPLSPALVVDNPGDDGWVALVLIDHNLELALKLLLLCVGRPGIVVNPPTHSISKNMT